MFVVTISETLQNLSMPVVPVYDVEEGRDSTRLYREIKVVLLFFLLFWDKSLSKYYVKLFKEQLFWSKPRNTRLPDNNQERRPITFELNLNAATLCDGESLHVSS